MADGWAGLYLYPHDLAKIGYLMLQKGQWDGKQVVSSKWVDQATQVQAKASGGSDYGYGWWIPTAGQYKEFVTDGRGGQYIPAVPELNMVVVTTGGGFDWNQHIPLILLAMVDTKNSLPDNSAGGDALNGVLEDISQAPPAQAVEPLSETARSISGKTYSFDFSPLDTKTLRLEFDGSAEAHLVATLYNQPDEDLQLGMDGVYRMYPIGEHGLNMGLRGSWLNENTFLFEYDEIANREAYSLRMVYEGDKVTIYAKERTHNATMTVVGVAEEQ